MKKDIFFSSLAINILVFTGFSVHAEIYKCKGADGEINFTSTPCGKKQTGIKRPEKKTEELNKDGTKKSKKQVIADRLKKEKEYLDANKRQREEEKEKKDKLEKHKNKIKKKCEQAKRDLAGVQRSKQVFVKDKKGKKRALNDAQRKAAELDAQRRISYWCRK